ncbi:ras GTPase-activating protein nGAP isoform X3 [Centruroides vittatus]|uniref:ras GTPase-activating protein nGAP isoform X3 n=1 Tax=Centruroides vittatus TaxID=120091 RepID=UPI00350E9F50
MKFEFKFCLKIFYIPENSWDKNKENPVTDQTNSRWRNVPVQTKQDHGLPWKPHYCVLLQDDCTFTHYPTEEMSIGDRLFVDLPRIRLDGGRQAFRRRWGYDISGPPPLPEEDEESELSETTSLRDERLLRFSSFETSYEKACSDRRGSAPTTPILGPRNMDTTPSRIVNFFSKRSFKTNPLKRTKSVTKLERKRSTMDGDSVPPSRLRTSRSHESLLQSSPGSLATLDLSQGDVQVTALHSSLLRQDHCFQLTSNGGTRYYTCRTAEERDKWVHSLRRTIHPNQDNVRRTENSLKIWILEAKGVSGKKRYFCELYLDKVLYARTSSKLKSDMCFWGENFEFNNLPKVNTITVTLYREADKKKRRDKNFLIGSVNIPVNSVNNRHLLEKWYPVITEKGNSGKDCPSIRIKSRFQTIDILPLTMYRDFLHYLKTEGKLLCEMLEPVIGVRAKEDIATALVHIMHKENMAKEFLAEVVMADIDKLDDHHLTFRGNTLATKATEAFMKLLGEKYLQDTLGGFLRAVLESNDDCEVDPMKVSNNTVLQKQQGNLMTFVEMAWVKIINSSTYFPKELQDVFHEYQLRLSAMGKKELGNNLISASIFLRFLCPAILSPSLFNLTQEYPQGRAARNLTLVAKTIQTLANFTRFGGKESFMEFMNEFVEREWSTMKAFLRQISSPIAKECYRPTEYEGYIDLGKELSILHGILIECVPRINQKCYQDHAATLQHILEKITVSLSSTSNNNQIYQSFLENKSKETNVNSIHHNNNNNNNNNNNELALNVYNNNSEKNCSSLNKVAPSSRNTYLLGSSKKPASDLSTADDYVLFSALNSDHFHEEKTSMKSDDPKYFNSEDVFSQKMKSQLVHIQNSMFQRVNFLEKNEIKNPSNISKISPVNRNHRPLPVNHFPERMPSIEDEAVTSSGENDHPNIKDSQLSISQLSTVASSGYQSFAYSQSSSPVDPVFQQETSHQPATCLPPPLAFSNPMYHFPSNSQSEEEKYENNKEKVQMNKICSDTAANFSTSTDSSSCGSTPMRERRNPVKSPLRTSPMHAATKSHSSHLQIRSLPHFARRCNRNENNHFYGTTGRKHYSLHKKFEEYNDKQNHTEDSELDTDTTNERNSRRSQKRLKYRSRRAKSESSNGKSIEEYEHEIEKLKHLMQKLQNKLSDTEQKLTHQENITVQVVSEWKTRLEAGEERIRKQQDEKDQQMKNIITRLITVEEELRREQQEMQEMIAVKQKVIDAQERKIQSLDSANTRLMTALTLLKDRYQLQGRNGISCSPPTVKMAILENGDGKYKSSSC